MVFPTTVGNPLYLIDVTNFTFDNVTVAGDPATQTGIGFLLDRSSSNTIINSNISNKLTGIHIAGANSGNIVTHNNIFSNEKNVSSTQAIELSLNGEGNYWGHSCPGPLFVPGTDSNAPNVVDSFHH